MSWDQPVFSSQCQSVGFNSETGDLIVTWKNGKKSAYAGVGEDLALQVANAASVGQFLNSEIKPNYAHRYI